MNFALLERIFERAKESRRPASSQTSPSSMSPSSMRKREKKAMNPVLHACLFATHNCLVLETWNAHRLPRRKAFYYTNRGAAKIVTHHLRVDTNKFLPMNNRVGIPESQCAVLLIRGRVRGERISGEISMTVSNNGPCGTDKTCFERFVRDHNPCN